MNNNNNNNDMFMDVDEKIEEEDSESVVVGTSDDSSDDDSDYVPSDDVNSDGVDEFDDIKDNACVHEHCPKYWYRLDRKLLDSGKDLWIDTKVNGALIRHKLVGVRYLEKDIRPVNRYKRCLFRVIMRFHMCNVVGFMENKNSEVIWIDNGPIYTYLEGKIGKLFIESPDYEKCDIVKEHFLKQTLMKKTEEKLEVEERDIFEKKEYVKDDGTLYVYPDTDDSEERIQMENKVCGKNMLGMRKVKENKVYHLSNRAFLNKLTAKNKDVYSVQQLKNVMKANNLKMGNMKVNKKNLADALIQHKKMYEETVFINFDVTECRKINVPDVPMSIQIERVNNMKKLKCMHNIE